MKTTRKPFDAMASVLVAILMWAALIGLCWVLLSVFTDAQAAEIDRRFDVGRCNTWHGGVGAQGAYTTCELPPPVIRVETVEVIKNVPTVIRSEPVQCPAPAPPKKPKVYHKPKPKPVC